MKNFKAMKSSTNQQGFTIIELVVVILLLGILTATALPRFIDVTDDARDAVRDATAGGLRTGMALYRAQAIAEDLSAGASPSSGDYTLTANANRYPAFSNGCDTIFAGLLQSGFTPFSDSTSGTTDCVYILTEVSRQLQLNTLTGEVIAL